MTFKADRGEVNLVTVTASNERLRFADAMNEDDLVDGESDAHAAADVVWSDSGADLLLGGTDDDTLVARDGEAGCSGTLTLNSLDGVAYGSGEFTDLAHGADVFTEVTVDLTPEGRTALTAGEVIVVAYGDGDDGYRAFTGGPGPAGG